MIAETVRKMNLDPRWPEERWDELRATYLDMVSKFDSQLGQVVGKLREKGLYEDTSVFVFSDHGDYTGDYGLVEKVQNCFEDALTNVPLVIKPAAGIAYKPRVTPALAELNDLCATLAGELRAQGLSEGTWDYLEPHAFAVQRRIENPQLRALHVMEG